MHGMENIELKYFVVFLRHTKEIHTKYLKLCHDLMVASYGYD